MTAGGLNVRRPDRALIVYTNLIKRYFRKTKPVVLGGIEASLRRISHYDFWSNSVRRSVLFDAKADILVYGMAEKTVVEIASRLSSGVEWRTLNGICYISDKPVREYIELPSHECVRTDMKSFTTMFHLFYQHNDPVTARGLFQQQDSRFLVQNPPGRCLSSRELDRIHELDFERDVHPCERKRGCVKALETIRFSIPTHRGCYGECHFCAITVHQGRTVISRSITSIVREAEHLTTLPDFKGYITDLGGPTANTYGFECQRKTKDGCCPDKRCLYPDICPELKVKHGPLITLLSKLRSVKGIKKIMVGSGVRYDLVLADTKQGDLYLEELVRFHISGQLKIAPEHSSTRVTQLMAKPDNAKLIRFKHKFDRIVAATGQKCFLTYYLMAAHPGCSENDMFDLRNFCQRELKIKPEQVQIFTPTPSTYSTLMFYTGKDPFSGLPLPVERNRHKREKQKRIICPP